MALSEPEESNKQPAVNTKSSGSENRSRTSSLSFTDLFDIEEIQKIQDAFAAATNVASIITHPDGTPITRPSRFCRLCIDIIRKTEKGLANCYRSDAVIGCHNPEGPIVQQCLSSGLWDAGASITVGGVHIANWLIGQVKNEELDEAAMLRYAAEIGADEQEYRAALCDVPTMSVDQFRHIAGFLFIFAGQLSNSAYQNLQQRQNLMERKKSEDALRETEFFLNKSQQVAHIGSYKFEIGEGRWFSSPSLNEIFGIGPDFPKTADGWLSLVAPEDREMMRDHLLRHVIEGQNRFEREYRIIRYRDRQERWVQGLGELEFNAAGNPVRMIGTIRDITERKTAEKEQAKLKEQLIHSQKMETIGLLAGGIAHDFNNLLTPILGYSEIMMLGINENDPKMTMLEQIQQAAERAKELTKRLLAFSRKQMLELKVINPGEIIRGLEPMLRRTIQENVQIKLDIPENISPVRADKGQIEQVIINLAINAQDAMPAGGVLTITAGDVDIDETYSCSHPESPPGCYVTFSVADTGTGMDRTTREHIFEPFFTTKEIGRGTGLGLATVYGIVNQHGGAICVYSEIGQGSVFKVFLPRVSEQGEPIKAVECQPGLIEKGHETILLAEDDEAVRKIISKVLQDLGYRPLVSENVDHCIELSRQHPGTIHLLLTDLIMPKKNGKELYEDLKSERPAIKALFMSGYTRDVIGIHGILDKGINFIQKPFTRTELSQKLRRVLEA